MYVSSKNGENFSILTLFSIFVFFISIIAKAESHLETTVVGTQISAPCISAISLENDIYGSHESDCLSESRINYDPYSPGPKYYYAKYYTFTLDEPSDIKLTLSPGNGSKRMDLRQGASTAGNIISSSSRTLNSTLTQGTYTLEISDNTLSSFYVYTEVFSGTSACLVEISPGVTQSSSWTQNCLSYHRVNTDPYSPNEPHRSKYFSFMITEPTDVSFSVGSSTSPYLYLLEGQGQTGEVVYSTYKSSIQRYLVPGIYTLEVSTYSYGAFGNFTVSFNILGDDQNCVSQLPLNEVITGAWSPNCGIESDLSYNDPYAPSQPQRANYYNFSVDEPSQAVFTLYTNKYEKIMNVFLGSDILSENTLIKSSHHGFGSYSNSLEVGLESGDYTLEVTHTGEVLPGSYSLDTDVRSNDKECDQDIDLNSLLASGDELYTIVDDSCPAKMLGLDFNLDPYAPSSDLVAKRFHFSVEDNEMELGIRTEFQHGKSGYIFLGKESGSGLYPLTASIENHTETVTESLFKRVLSAGDYVLEVVSPPWQTVAASITFNHSINVCDRWIKLGETKLGEFQFQCLAAKKPPVYNNDPYSNEPPDYFYSKSFSFILDDEQEVEIDAISNRFTPDVYLISGGERKVGGSSVIIQSGNVPLRKNLSKGIYTIELTSSESDNPINDFILMLSKPASN